jgi:hypothetical protein
MMHPIFHAFRIHGAALSLTFLRAELGAAALTAEAGDDGGQNKDAGSRKGHSRGITGLLRIEGPNENHLAHDRTRALICKPRKQGANRVRQQLSQMRGDHAPTRLAP